LLRNYQKVLLLNLRKLIVGHLPGLIKDLSSSPVMTLPPPKKATDKINETHYKINNSSIFGVQFVTRVLDPAEIRTVIRHILLRNWVKRFLIQPFGKDQILI